MTRWRVSVEIRAPVISLSTSDTLDCDTPAMRATSVMVSLERLRSVRVSLARLPSAIVLRFGSRVLSSHTQRASVTAIKRQHAHNFPLTANIISAIFPNVKQVCCFARTQKPDLWEERQ